jgi:hypothetical protein
MKQPKGEVVMYVLNYVKLSEGCENKGLCVISQKYKSFCAKVLNYKCNFHFY